MNQAKIKFHVLLFIFRFPLILLLAFCVDSSNPIRPSSRDNYEGQSVNEFGITKFLTRLVSVERREIRLGIEPSCIQLDLGCGVALIHPLRS